MKKLFLLLIAAFTSITVLASAPVISFTVEGATCNGSANGTITINSVNGCSGGPFALILDGTPIAINQTIRDLAAGPHTLTVTDANVACTFSEQIFVPEPHEIAIAFSVTSASCKGSFSGSIKLEGVSGGNPPFTSITLDGTPIAIGETRINQRGGAHTINILNGTCQFSQQIFVPEPDPISVVFDTTGVTCYGGSNGTITIKSIGGGTPPYNLLLDGNPIVLGDQLTNQRAGAHTLIVSDSTNGCMFSQQIFVGEPNPINVVFDVVDVTCFGGNNGTITIRDVAGGQPPYTLILDGDPIVVGDPISNRRAGVHSLLVIDSSANPCMFSQQIFVGEPDPISINFTVTGTECNNSSDGSITITNVRGGTPPYTIELDGQLIQLNQDVTGLQAGTHLVTITDSTNSCTVTKQITVPTPNPIQGSFQVTNATCNGAATGSITLTSATGGPANSTYTYTIDGGPALALGAQAPNLSAGPHTAIITARGQNQTTCTSSSQQIFVGEPDIFQTTYTVKPVTCHNGKDGSITVTKITGGTPFNDPIEPYELTLDGKVLQFNTASDPLTFGAHTLTITDLNGCTSSQQITIPNPGEFALEFTVKKVTCHGGNDGAITIVAVSGGTMSPTATCAASFSVCIDNRPCVPVGTPVENLMAGAHTVTIVDDNGCRFTQQITVPEPDNIEFGFKVDATTCNGVANGKITVTSAIGGTPGTGTVGDPTYTYTVDGGAVTNLGATVSNLKPGAHTVVVTDSLGCTTTRQLFVPEPDPFQITFTTKDVTCNAGSDGEFTLTDVRGGTPDYSYTIDDSDLADLGDTLTGLTAGAHTLTVYDANACAQSWQIFINQPENTRITKVKTTHATSGQNNGSIDIGAESNTSLRYSITGIAGAFQERSLFRCLAPGIYDLAVRSAGGCEGTCALGCAVVGTAQPLELKAVTTNCSITATAEGGTAPFEFALNNGPFCNPDDGSCNNPCTDSDTFTFSGLIDGCTYVVKVRDADGHVTCTNVTIPAITNGIERLITRKVCCNCGTCGTQSKCGSGSCNTSCAGGACPIK